MHNKFAKTSNVKAFLAAYGRLEERGAREACWMIVPAAPGLGKTRTMQYFAVQKNAVYVRAKVNWTARWMLEEMAAELGLDGGGTTKTLFASVLGALVQTGRPIVVDEARNLLHDTKLFETLRDLSDVSENPVVLSGEDFVLKRLTTRYPQIKSRLSEIVVFKPLGTDDIRIVCDDLSEVKIADDLVTEIMKQSKGWMREVKNSIGAIERLAQIRSLKDVTVKDVVGIRLCQDRDNPGPGKNGGV